MYYALLYLFIQHNHDYVIAALTSAFLYNQPHTFHTLTVFCTGRDNINSCCIDATVPENVGKLGDILFDTVENSGEQMPQIMRKYLFGFHLCFKAEVFHFPPNICATHRLARAGNENCARREFLLGYIPKQFLLQITNDENVSRLALERDCSFAFADGFHGDELQFADTDASTANRLQDQTKSLVVLSVCRPA